MASQILVTGGAGFIGSHLVERLLRDGSKVVVLDDFSTGRIENLLGVKDHAHLRVVRSKVSDCSALSRLVGESQFIFHLAAAVGVDLVLRSGIETIKTNLDETEAILDAASASGTPLLLTSTSEVYGKSTREAFSEDDDLLIGPPQFSRWSYACSKLMDEFLALAHARERKLPATIARLFNTVGPRQSGRYGMVLPRFIQAALAGKPLEVFGDGLQTRCFCDVRDTVDALVRLQNCAKARGQVFNVGSTEEVTIRDLAERIVRAANSSSRIETVDYAQAYAPGFEDMLRRKPVVEKLERFTGFRPTIALEEIIHRTIASMREET